MIGTEFRKQCIDCKYADLSYSDFPCSDCVNPGGKQRWEPQRGYHSELAEANEEDAAKSLPETVPSSTGLGMGNDAFETLVNELREKSMDTLLKKNARYANDDRLHNFRLGAALIGGTPAQAALGYMAKHLAALIDKVQKDDFSDRDDLLEKCQDIINYIVFIWCCGNEGRTK